MKIKQLILSIVTLMAFAAPAQADFNNITDDLFGAYQNVTPGAAYESQNRYVLAGGSVVTRNPIQNANLFTVTPPFIDGGCRGITAYGGSFSFINKAQFTQLLRNIASNAVGYAFKLALTTLCPTCNSVMEKLASKMNQLNDMMKNSCSAAKALVEAGGVYQGMLENAKEEMSSVKTALGSFTDSFSGYHDLETKTAKEIADDSPAATDKIIDPQNAVWHALSETNAASWFVDNTRHSKEIMMSVTGTVVKHNLDKNSAACRATGASNDEFCYNPFPGTLKFDDLLNGTLNTDGSTRTVNILVCDEPTLCLAPVNTATTTGFDGTRKRVRDLVLGDGNNAGIVDAISTKSALSAAQQIFLESTRLPIKALLMNVVGDEGAMRSIAEESINMIAEEMTARLMYEMISTVRKAVDISGVQMSNIIDKQLTERIEEYQELKSQADIKITRYQQILNVAETIRKSVIASNDKAVPGDIGTRNVNLGN